MRIGILTQPLHTNYGGILQAFALQHVLKHMGHEVWTIDIPFRTTLYLDCKAIAIRFIRKYLLGRKHIVTIFPERPSKAEYELISQHMRGFVEKYIQRTETIPLVEKIRALKKYQFDVYIVGSDQVWRLEYSPGIPTFFLDFLENDHKPKRIAYAASFGTGNWEYTPELTKKCKKLAQRFDAISVREDDAVQICKEYLDIDACRLPDPTMLLNQEDYAAFVTTGNPTDKKKITVYVLDKSEANDSIIEKVRSRLDLPIKPVMPNTSYLKEAMNTPADCIFPPVEQWLEGFIDADFVITDSFHGVIFSLIFNKLFIAIGNQYRGLSRFRSLLKLFDLEERLVSTQDEVTTALIDKNIDFKKVNTIMKEQQEDAFNFLNKYLVG